MENIYQSGHLKRCNLSASLEEEKLILNELEKKLDVNSVRLKRYISLPDLTHSVNSPIRAVVEIVLDIASFKNFDIIDTPQIISPEIVFDLFNFPKDHPARSASDTYYVDEKHILRPHTSLMWKYYFDIPEIRNKLEKYGSVGALSYGKVYRRDEIDWQHSNILHQFDGLFVCKKDIKKIKQLDLENICSEVTRSLLGKNVKERFLVDKFPYTDPSIEMNVAWDDKWVEINGAGIVHPQVLKNLNINPDIYNGWAFGFGVDRLAMLKMKIPDIRLLWSKDERVTNQLKDLNNIYKAVSKFPSVIRDISFIVDKNNFNLNAYYESIRDTLGDKYVEEAKLLDQYENEEKFGKNKISYTLRITYRHLERTLTNLEINEMHEKLHLITETQYKAQVRKA
jgi:phenylalanyl-tRNA synthetase alpha chain